MKTPKKGISRIWKWIIGVVGVLLILLLSTSWFLSLRWSPIIKNRLQEMVFQATDSLYSLEYTDLDLNLIRGSATIKNIKLVPDTLLYAKKVAQKSADDVIYTMDIGKLKIRGVQLRRLLMDKSLSIQSIGIDHSHILLTRYHHNFKDSIPKAKKKPLYEIIASSLKNVRVERLNLSSVNFSMVNFKDSTTQSTTELKSIQMQVEDIFIDSTAHQDPERFFYTKSVAMALPGFKYETPDSLHYVSFDSVFYHSKHQNLVVKKLKFAPLVSRKEYYQRLGKAKDMIKLEFDELTFENIDPNQFLENQLLHAQKLKIKTGKLDVSNDLRYPRLKNSKIGHAPHQKLMKLRQKVKIDSVLVQGVDISYAEISEKFEREGKITFNNATGTLYNVTNDSATLSQDKLLRANLTALLMNTGKLHTEFTFDMLSKNGTFTTKGQLGPMKGRVLNQIITPLLNAEIASLDIRGVKFDIRGTDYRNRGTLNLDYDDLKINILQNDDSGDKNKKGLISFVANQFIVNNSNPDAKGRYLIANINYKRPPEYSYFKTLWKSLLEGIKYSAGINHEKEKKLTNVVNFFKNSFGNNKDQEQDRRKKR